MAFIYRWSVEQIGLYIHVFLFCQALRGVSQWMPTQETYPFPVAISFYLRINTGSQFLPSVKETPWQTRPLHRFFSSTSVHSDHSSFRIPTLLICPSQRQQGESKLCKEHLWYKVMVKISLQFLPVKIEHLFQYSTTSLERPPHWP